MKTGLFVGLTCLDLIYYLPGVPSENEKTKTDDYATWVGGPAANAAVTYALLGGAAVLVSRIGDSAYGQLLKKELQEGFGVTVVDCAAGATTLPSIASIAVNTLSGTRTVWSGQPAWPAGTIAVIEEMLADSCFVLTDGNLPDLSLAALKAARARAIPTVLDAGSWKASLAAILALTDEAIASADCRPPEPDQGFMDIARALGVRDIAVTDGEKPLRWESGAAKGAVTPPTVRAVDTLAAGDVFHGAYCYFRHLSHLSFAAALERAAAVAAASVACRGPRDGVQAYVMAGRSS